MLTGLQVSFSLKKMVVRDHEVVVVVVIVVVVVFVVILGPKINKLTAI